ncbi:MAG TPA: hypothetical protein VIU44_06675 [Gaiellaceae bacterium]
MRARVAVQQGARAPITVALAWRRYLVATRTASQADYERIEGRAWERLRSELAFLEQPLPEPDE